MIKKINLRRHRNKRIAITGQTKGLSNTVTCPRHQLEEEAYRKQEVHEETLVHHHIFQQSEMSGLPGYGLHSSRIY